MAYGLGWEPNRLFEGSAPNECEEGTGRQDSDWRFLRCHQEILVPTNQDLGAGGDRSGQHPFVIRVPEGDGAGNLRVGNDWAPLENSLDREKRWGAGLQLFGKDAPDLFRDDLGNDEVVS